MSQILYLPKSIPLSTTGTLLAGAKLYTYLTNTSTPQSVYTDYGLSVAHANPVEADSNGVFPVMYWGNTAPYRLTLKTSAGNTLAGYPVDDCGPDTPTGLGVPSLAASNTFTGVNKLQGAEMRLLLDETDAGTDKRLWDIDIQAGVLKLRTRTDADGTGKDILTVTRGAGTAVSSIDIGNSSDAPTIKVSGSTFIENTSGTGTLTGCTTAPTVTIYFSRVGNLVIASFTSISATSNSTAFELTGAIPASYRPAKTQQCACQIQDNSVYSAGFARITASGADIAFIRGDQAAVTASGTKGVYVSTLVWSIY